MKLVRWMQFTWDLAKVPEAQGIIDPQFQIRPSTKEDLQTLQSVVTSSFYLDSGWNEISGRLNASFQKRFEELSKEGSVRALVMTHGKRVVGGSIYSCEEETSSHLITGPCLLQEYSNRGLGSALLHHNLLALKEAGLRKACAVTKWGTTAAKFVYSKFNSVSLAYQPEPGGS